MGMRISPSDLLPQETLIHSKMANLIVSIKEHGLSRFAFDGAMKYVGMAGKEAIGGQIHLTNYRLLFKSHAANRLTGSYNIFLPNITGVANTSRWITRKFKVSTAMKDTEFVLWGIPAFLAAIDKARATLTPAELPKLRQAVLANPAAVGEGLAKFAVLETINQIARGALTIVDILENPSPVQLGSVLDLLDLFREDRT